MFTTELICVSRVPILLLSLWLQLEDGREFLCANRFTIADINITYALVLGTTFGLETQYKPQVSQIADQYSRIYCFRRTETYAEVEAPRLPCLICSCKSYSMHAFWMICKTGVVYVLMEVLLLLMLLAD